jgi:hypothetical protein
MILASISYFPPTNAMTFWLAYAYTLLYDTAWHI